MTSYILVFQARSSSAEDQEVLLFRTDQSGRAWPVKGPSGPQAPHGGRQKKKRVKILMMMVRKTNDRAAVWKLIHF